MSLFTQENPQLGSSATAGGYKILGPDVINVSISASTTSQTVFIVPNPSTSGTSSNNLSFKVANVSVVYGTAGGTGASVTIEHLTGTQAAGGGTAMLTTPVLLTGAANTVQTVTPATTLTSAQLILSPGDRLGIVMAGTLTGLANGLVQITIAIA